MSKRKAKIKNKKAAAKAAKRVTRFSNYFAKRIDDETDEIKKQVLEEKLALFKDEQERNFTKPLSKTPKAKTYPPIRKQSGKQSRWISFVQGGATGLKK